MAIFRQRAESGLGGDEIGRFQPDDLPSAGFVARGRSAVRTLVDLVLPPTCPTCRRPVGDNGGLCARCWGRLTLIEYPYCARLGTPFTYDIGENALSADAIANPPPFDRLRAVAVYDDIAGQLVRSFKFNDRVDIGPAMANWMVRAGRTILDDADVIVPVPLHRMRLWQRRFNQAAVLAQTIGRTRAVEVIPDALIRVRRTRQQVGLSIREREDNVRGAFRVSAERLNSVAGQRVLLVDDVYTTGATVRAATRALLRKGVASVDVLVFARVVSDRAGTI